MDFIAGAIGGGLSTAVGYPLETVKVRIQTESRYKGFWHCVQETYRTEKVRGFYKGVTASVLAVSVVSSVSFGTYKNFLCTICKLRYGAADAKPSKLDVSLAGAAAGAVRVVLTNPSEVAKVRMQTQKDPHPSITHQPDSKPKYQGSLHCLKVIIKEEGFGGLYKGCSALLCRDCSASALYFLSYSALCDWLTPAGRNKPDFLVVLLSGGFAGVLAWGLATPMDVIKSRMQTDELGQQNLARLGFQQARDFLQALHRIISSLPQDVEQLGTALEAICSHPGARSWLLCTGTCNISLACDQLISGQLTLTSSLWEQSEAYLEGVLKHPVSVLQNKDHLQQINTYKDHSKDMEVLLMKGDN